MKIKYLKQIFLIAGLSAATLSCSDDFVETEFGQSVEQAPLTSLNEVESFARGMYASMRSKTYYGRDYSVFAEVRSDEMYSNLYAGYFNSVYNYTMTSSDAYARDTYAQIYTAVAKANIIINTDVNGITGTESDKAAVQYHQGQAYAMRALYFFDLLRLYGQKYTGGTTGIVTPLEYNPKNQQARGTIAENEAQIESDFNKALQLMTEFNDYEDPTTKTEVSSYAVKALMCRYYLYKEDYAKVRSLVNDIVESGVYAVIPKDSYVGSWKSSSQNNSIFELAVGVAGANGTDSLGYIYNIDGYGNTVINPNTIATFADNDVRTSLIDYDGKKEYYLDGKYPSLEGADNLKLIRYEEVILDGVEAELNGGDPEKALAYYRELLVNRLNPTQDIDENGDLVVDAEGNPVMLSAQEQVNKIKSVNMDMLKAERSKELLGEGFRMWDMLRWGDVIERPDGASTDPQLLAFPIPRAETDIAGTPVTSNPGYDN